MLTHAFVLGSLSLMSQVPCLLISIVLPVLCHGPGPWCLDWSPAQTVGMCFHGYSCTAGRPPPAAPPPESEAAGNAPSQPQPPAMPPSATHTQRGAHTHTHRKTFRGKHTQREIHKVWSTSSKINHIMQTYEIQTPSV